MPHQLVQSHISHDCVEACNDLLTAAKAGDVIGFGIVALLRRRRFIVDVCGEAARDPVLARGALRDLDDLLRDIAHAQRDNPTT
jgi:hypothetical protein